MTVHHQVPSAHGPLSQTCAPDHELALRARDRKSPATAFVFQALPNDIVQLLFYPVPGHGRGHRRYLPATALIAFACTCKAAAAMALPALYAHLHLTSLPALPKLYTALASPSSPFMSALQLRDHVRSLTVSPLFLCAEQFHLIAEAFQTGCKLDPHSWIVSTELVHQRFTQDTLDKLPMSWLIRLATVCPHLVSIDLSNLPYLGRACPAVLYGFQSLADLLRPRGGRFTSASKTPVSAVLINHGTKRPSQFEQDVFFVTRIDWTHKAIDVANHVDSREMGTVPDKTEMTPADIALVPFADLVGITEQATWTIRDISFNVPDFEWIALLPQEDLEDTSAWMQSEQLLLSRAGIRKGQDRVFDLNPASAAHAPIKRNASFASPSVALAAESMQSCGIRPESQCTQLELHGSNCTASWMCMMNRPQEFKQKSDVKLAEFRQMSANPFSALSRFVAHNAFFLTTEHGPASLHVISKAMPNLVDLSLLNMHAPMDFLLLFIDGCFLRRLPAAGKPLQHLRLSCYCSMHEDPAWVAGVPSEWGTGTADDAVFLTSIPLAARTRLRSLALELSGPGSYTIARRHQPKLAVLPYVLESLESLTLLSVQMVVIPPGVRGASACPFMLASLLRGLTRQLPMPFNSIPFPRLRRLHVSTSSLLPLDPTHPIVPLPNRLPTCPRLQVLELHASMTTPLTARDVASTLAEFPLLVSATFEPTSLSKKDLQRIVNKVFCLNPLMHGDGPKLRHLVLDNISGATCARYLTAPHVLHVDDLGAPPVRVQPTLVESGPKAWCDKDGQLVPCATCHKLVRVPRPSGGWAQLMANIGLDESDEDLFRFMRKGPSVPPQPGTHCPNCAPMRIERFWETIGKEEGVVDATKDADLCDDDAGWEDYASDDDGGDDAWEDYASDEDDSQDGMDCDDGVLQGQVDDAGLVLGRSSSAPGLWGFKMRFPGML